MVSTDGRLHLALEAEPESISRARAAVAELAEDLGVEEERVGDLKTIVSEACANVVRHAYPQGSGSFEVDAVAEGDLLTIVVRDFGEGVRPRVETEPASLRLGLGLISTLSSHFEISGGEGGGTEVLMQVPLQLSR